MIPGCSLHIQKSPAGSLSPVLHGNCKRQPHDHRHERGPEHAGIFWHPRQFCSGPYAPGTSGPCSCWIGKSLYEYTVNKMLNIKLLNLVVISDNPGEMPDKKVTGDQGIFAGSIQEPAPLPGNITGA